MTIRLKTTLANALLDLITAEIDIDAGAGGIDVYDGTQPATPETAITTQTLLAELVLTDPAAAAAATSILTFSAVADDSSANATGTATWARITDNSGDAVFDVNVTATGGGGGIEFTTTSFIAGKNVSMSSFLINL